MMIKRKTAERRKNRKKERQKERKKGRKKERKKERKKRITKQSKVGSWQKLEVARKEEQRHGLINNI